MKKGRKIRRSKSLYKRRKGSARKFLEIAVMLVVVCGLGFVGWTVGKAIQDYFGENGQHTGDGVLDVPVDIDIPDEPPYGEEDEPDEPYTPSAGFNAVVLPSTALRNMTSLSSQIEQAKNNGFNAVVLELKDSVGNLNFASTFPQIQNSDIINENSLTAAQIFAAFEGTGITPVVRINTLLDRLSPSAVDDSSYVFEAGGGRWLDDTIERGGKLWANPFLQGTRDYHAFIVDELVNAGFSDIILANTIFPFFRNYDVGVLGSQFTAPSTRFEGLVGFALALEAAKGEANLFLEMTVADVIEFPSFSSSAELLRGKSELDGFNLLLVFNRDDFGEEYRTGEMSTAVLPSEASALVSLVYKQAANHTGDFNIIPYLSREGLTDREITEILQTFGELKFESFVIR
jgi:hypothetical protein